MSRTNDQMNLWGRLCVTILVSLEQHCRPATICRLLAFLSQSGDQAGKGKARTGDLSWLTGVSHTTNVILYKEGSLRLVGFWLLPLFLLLLLLPVPEEGLLVSLLPRTALAFIVAAV